MPIEVDVYYDFRSPYAYFADHRLRRKSFIPPVPVEWRWRPVSIDILLNLQAGRDVWAPYDDPLSAPKRRHLIADVRRCAAFYGAPLRPPQPARPNSVPALCAALLFDQAGTRHDNYRHAIFEALWSGQRDIADRAVLAECLASTDARDVLADAFSTPARDALAAETRRAYEAGIFGVPSFVYEGEVYFGNDRLDMLGWRLGK